MNYFEQANKLCAEGKSFVTVTMVSTRGSAPQDPGAKAIITNEGLVFGTVGGGKVEARAIEKSITLINEDASDPVYLTWNLQTEIGMTCGGEVSFLFELFQAKTWPIVIFGAGHVAQALTRTLANLNCQVTCIDSRQEWIDKLDKNTKSICHPNPADLVATFNSAKTYFISMTKGHASDVPIIEAIYNHAPNAPYIGVIGSIAKGNAIKKDLFKLDISESFFNKIKIPIGLDVGSNHPYEIAISITAELLQIRKKNKVL
jgi:xanthine dehydrogenase accessory factor